MSMLWGTRFLVLFVSCLWSFQEKDASAEEPGSSADPMSREIDRLRGLGYIEVTDEPVDAEILSEELDMSRGAGGTPYSRISVSGFRS